MCDSMLFPLPDEEEKGLSLQTGLLRKKDAGRSFELTLPAWRAFQGSDIQMEQMRCIDPDLVSEIALSPFQVTLMVNTLEYEGRVNTESGIELHGRELVAKFALASLCYFF